MPRDRTLTNGSNRDGRVVRSDRNRQAIIDALIELVGNGNLQPTAEQLAEQAGFSTRTVFRHFSDLEHLFAHMGERMRAELAPIVEKEVPKGDMARRVNDVVELRCRVYERLAPYIHAGDIQLWRSPTIRAQRESMRHDLNVELLRWLPEMEHATSDLVDAINMATSFGAWDSLRGLQGLSHARAFGATKRTVLALTRELA